jgi:stage IV sporulation protein FB
MMQTGYLTVGRFGGAPVRIHWTTPIGAFAFTGARFAPGAWAAFLLLILIHELGHAVFVRSFHLRLQSIDVHGIGGVCNYFGDTSPIRRALIAWGGIVGQSIVLAIAFTLSLVLPPIQTPWVAQLLAALITTNLWLMAINLIPIPGFDGAEAWKLFAPSGLKAWWRRRAMLKNRPTAGTRGVVRQMPASKRSVADDILENTPTDRKRPPPSMMN